MARTRRTSNKYFFGLEKKKQKHTITALRTQEGQVTSDMDILHEAKRFYQMLYTKETTDTDIQDSFLGNTEMRLSSTQSIHMWGTIDDSRTNQHPELDAQ